jgi:hypothetical protein
MARSVFRIMKGKAITSPAASASNWASQGIQSCEHPTVAAEDNMAESVSFRELPDHVRKRVEEALKKADVKEPYEIGHEWDIMGFILRQELAREGIERIGQVAQQVATHVAATPQAGAPAVASAASAKSPHPVAAFLPNKRIICGFIQDPAILQR